ncbi:MAG: hypothetical protein HYT87_17595, partial [Nitrospirae bacterium]|nr:hypothetical protein [Nitrospirota bacterium]
MPVSESPSSSVFQVVGQVLDLESGDPLFNVRVRINSIGQESRIVEGMTDGLGLFTLAVEEKGPASIWAEKEGYSPQSQILEIGATSDSIQLKLRPVTFVQDLEVSPEMGSLEVKAPDNSLSVVIPNPSESLGIRGVLRAEITVGDPRQNQDAFPGGFMAVDDGIRGGVRGSPKRILRRQADGSGSEIVELASVMFGNITLRDTDGNVVSSLAQPAKVRMKIPPGTMNPSTNAPFLVGDTIPTYYIDEQLGTWVPEIDESGNQVLGTIVEGPDGLYNEFLARHFSWWNLDQPIRTRGCVRGRVADLCGQSKAGYRVCGKGVSFNGATCNGVLGTAAQSLGIGGVDKKEEPTAS